MCSECGDDQPVCSFCGDACYGSCGDLDTCPSCWTYKHDPIEMDIYDEEAMEDCMDAQCLCHCHDDVHAECGMRYEHGVWKDEETDGPPFEREGVFPFLKLPGELREKIYGLAFLQDGNQRRFPDTYHRGTIHTALLRTCRQVYEESGNLPLSLNTLKFPSALFALNFLGFSLLPNQRHLMTRIHIEFFYHEFSSASWELLLRQLAKMPITHLGLTIKGGCWKESFLGHTCFASRFAAMMKGVKTLEVTLGSCKITKAVKKEIQEEMREVLIKGYKRPKNANLKTKRSPTSENGDKNLLKKAKKGFNTTKHQTKLVISPKSQRLGMRSRKPERFAVQAAKEDTKQLLLTQYDKLKQYATSIELDTASVKIRLDNAREAAEVADRSKFEQLAHGIFVTLEERYDRIAAARKGISLFANGVSAATPVEAMSSQESKDFPESQASSQLST